MADQVESLVPESLLLNAWLQNEVRNIDRRLNLSPKSGHGGFNQSSLPNSTYFTYMRSACTPMRSCAKYDKVQAALRLQLPAVGLSGMLKLLSFPSHSILPATKT